MKHHDRIGTREKKAPKIKENFLEHFDNIELELKDVPITYLEL